MDSLENMTGFLAILRGFPAWGAPWYSVYASNPSSIASFTSSAPSASPVSSFPDLFFSPLFFSIFFLTRTEKQRWCCCILWLLSSITTKILFSFSLSLAPPFLLLFSSLNVKNKKDKKNRRDLNQGHSVPQYERMPIRFKRNNSGKENKL